MFAPCINSIKTPFIIPTDAHNYKIIGMLKTIKIPTITPTCFGSRRNHHQGAISCLAKNYNYDSIVLVVNDVVIDGIPARCALHACATGWYAAITLTTSLTTSTIES